MGKTPVCLVCQKEMEKGFITEMGDGGVAVHMPRWCAGEPKRTQYVGEVDSAQHMKGLALTAYRCPECEAIRLYAPSKGSKP